MMQAAGPYRLQRPLSACDVGDVWSGVDDRGSSVTVAVLNERASADERWRGAFAAAAEALGGAGADQLPITDSDHDAAQPWVACAVERGPGAAQLFVALGRQMEPVTPAAGDAPVSGGPSALASISGAPTGGARHAARPDGSVSAGAHAAVPGAEEPAPAVDRPVPSGAQASTAAVDRPVPSGARASTEAIDRPVPSGAETLQAPSSDDRSPLIPRQQPPGSEPAAGTPADAQMSAATAAGHRQTEVAAGHPMEVAAGLPWQTSGAGGYPAFDGADHPPADHPPADQLPVFAEPRSGAGGDLPSSAHPYSPYPVSGGAETWQRSRVFGDRPPPAPRRNLLLLACVALAALLVGAGGAVAVMAARGGDDATARAPYTAEQLLLPAAAPAAPGVEPPRSGGWPSSWPEFRASETTKPMTNLPGLGFDFKAPPTWTCTKQGQAEAAVRYRCGTGEGAAAAGGDVIVRTCQPVCDEARRRQLRQLEEAWGLRWTRSGPFNAWARTTEIEGRRLDGLVYVAFWRSVPEGQIDRQLVVRMTAPPAGGDDLKKVANSVRDSTFTQ